MTPTIFRPERGVTTMYHNGAYIDRVIAVEDPQRDGPALRLADHTPSSGYTALLEAADDAALDLSGSSDGRTVGVAYLTEDGDCEAFHPEGRSVYKIGAQHVDTPADAGFNVFFDRPYDYRFEEYPISEDAAVRAIEESYGWGHAPEEMEEGEQVGVLVADADGEYVAVHLTR